MYILFVQPSNHMNPLKVMHLYFFTYFKEFYDFNNVQIKEKIVFFT